MSTYFFSAPGRTEISGNHTDHQHGCVLAAAVNLERTYFSRRFKQLTGFGFQEYLLKTRVLAAQRLLLETALPVGEIAERCGFASGNYFGDVFCRYQGVSPTEYRRQNRPSPLFPPQ